LLDFNFVVNLIPQRLRVKHWSRFINTLEFLRDRTAAGQEWDLFLTNLRLHEGIKIRLRAGRAPTAQNVRDELDMLGAGGVFQFLAPHCPQHATYNFIPRPQALQQDLALWPGGNNL
jgi:hypothetical protein